jgi:glutamine amidotransferase
MQLMTKCSEEGRLPGLGWLDAKVVRFRFPEGSGLKIPHMGWNTLSILRENPLIKSEKRQRFYFVHSYHVVCMDESDITATCQYGYDFVAAFAHGNIFGVQFHPEKSHRFGMAVVRNFLEMKIC